jgi:hypothetical protein
MSQEVSKSAAICSFSTRDSCQETHVQRNLRCDIKRLKKDREALGFEEKSRTLTGKTYTYRKDPHIAVITICWQSHHQRLLLTVHIVMLGAIHVHCALLVAVLA